MDFLAQKIFTALRIFLHYRLKTKIFLGWQKIFVPRHFFRSQENFCRQFIMQNIYCAKKSFISVQSFVLGVFLKNVNFILVFFNHEKKSSSLIKIGHTLSINLHKCNLLKYCEINGRKSDKQSKDFTMLITMIMMIRLYTYWRVLVVTRNFNITCHCSYDLYEHLDIHMLSMVVIIIWKVNESHD